MTGSVTDPRQAWEGYTMQLTTRGDWRRCEATRNAAAIAALGVPIAPQKTFRVREGDEQINFLHEPASVFPQWQSLGPIKQVLSQWEMSKLDACHAFVDVRRAIRNAEMLSDWLRDVNSCALGYDAERQRALDSWPACDASRPVCQGDQPGQGGSTGHSWLPRARLGAGR